MNENLLLVAFLGFSAGYILKTLIAGFKTFSMSANFVQHNAYAALILLGTAVYKIAYIDQLCATTLEKIGKSEDAKLMRLELQSKFDDWKEAAVEEYKENYPDPYKWQLEFDDWKGLMAALNDIYREKKV